MQDAGLSQTEMFPPVLRENNTAGAITGLCNRLLDVIVSDKVRSQRSFQSRLTLLLQEIKALLGDTRLVHCGHVAVRKFNAHESLSQSSNDTINLEGIMTMR